LGIVLDSSIIIRFEREQTDVESFGQSLNQSLFLAAITVSEILVGSLLADSVSRRSHRTDFLDALLTLVPVLPFGIPEARVHAEARVALRTMGQSIGAADLLIAATALANGHDVLTANVREFERVPGLRVVTLDDLAT
jgi:tRNA(fMet)-specific endonuclease VapC